MTTRIEIESVTVAFRGVRAIDDVTLEFEPGRTYGLLGPNGSGKTTMLNVLSGHIRPSRGRVRYGGQSRLGGAAGLSRWGLRRTFQNLRLIPSLTVLHNVALGADRPRGGPRNPFGAGREKTTVSRAREVLESLGIADLERELPGTLPYGLQRRVEIARAIVGDPIVLLLDEPTAGMGDEERAAIMEILGAWQKDDRTLIIVEHSLWLMQAMCDYLYALDAGKLIERGQVDHVLGSAAVRRAYLGEEAADAAA